MVFFQYYHTLLLFMIWLGLLKLMMTTHTLLCLSRWRYENLIVDQGVCIFLFNYRAFMMWFWFNNNDHMNLYVLFNYMCSYHMGRLEHGRWVARFPVALLLWECCYLLLFGVAGFDGLVVFLFSYLSVLGFIPWFYFVLYSFGFISSLTVSLVTSHNF